MAIQARSSKEKCLTLLKCALDLGTLLVHVDHVVLRVIYGQFIDFCCLLGSLNERKEHADINISVEFHKRFHSEQIGRILAPRNNRLSTHVRQNAVIKISRSRLECSLEQLTVKVRLRLGSLRPVEKRASELQSLRSTLLSSSKRRFFEQIATDRQAVKPMPTTKDNGISVF